MQPKMHRSFSERVITLVERRGERRLVVTNGQFFDPSWLLEPLDLASLEVGESFLLERVGAEKFRIKHRIPKDSVHHTIYRIISEQKLDFGFSEEAERELSEIIERGILTDGLVDLLDLPFVTIDGELTRDLDQAVFIERAESSRLSVLPGVRFVAWYAIADPAFFVKPGMHLFDEALERGASIYFAGLMCPMLPCVLSTELCSLNPNVIRRSLTFAMQIDEDGNCVRTDLFHSKIRSRAKLTNQDVLGLYRGGEASPLWTSPYRESLFLFRTLGLLRIREARSRNVVHFNRVSLDVYLDEEGKDFILDFDERDEVDQYNEQLSLLCNTEGGKILNRLKERDSEFYAIFRIHESPSSDVLEELEHFIQALCKDQNLDASWLWDRESVSLADYLDFLPESSLDSGRFYRIRQAIERQILMMQRRSVFSPKPGEHSALGVTPYARFSAPMREIVGIFTHMVALSTLESSSEYIEDRILCQRIVESANRSRDIQKRVSKAIDSFAIDAAIRRDFDLPEQDRPIHLGTILGLKSNSMYVRLDSPPIELKVYYDDISQILGEPVIVNASKTVLHSASYGVHFVVGDSIGLRVSRYDPFKHKWSVIPVF